MIALTKKLASEMGFRAILLCGDRIIISDKDSFLPKH